LLILLSRPSLLLLHDLDLLFRVVELLARFIQLRLQRRLFLNLLVQREAKSYEQNQNEKQLHARIISHEIDRGTLRTCNDFPPMSLKIPISSSKHTFHRPVSEPFAILDRARPESRALANRQQLRIPMSKEIQAEEGTQLKKLADVLTEKSGALDIHETVQDAGDKLRSLEADSLPVSEDRRLVGRVTERHPDRSAAGHGHDPNVERVGSCMSRELIFCYEDQDRSEAEKLMNEKGLTYLPIVDHEMRIVGIVTRQDLAPKAAASQDPAETTCGTLAGQPAPGPSLK
jgi:CBS domain-containing protein